MLALSGRKQDGPSPVPIATVRSSPTCYLVMSTTSSSKYYRRESSSGTILPAYPRPKDHLSSLPFELLCDIIKYTIDRASFKPIASLKSLAIVNDTIRRGCVSVGLFENFVLTLRRGTNSVTDACEVLKSNANLAKSIRTLTISDTVIAECPSALSRFLQLLPNLEKFRIKGTASSKPLNHGTLISFNGLLHKTLISTRYLQNLKSLDLINLSLTHLITDIASVNPKIRQLNLITCENLGSPNPTNFTSCKVQYLHYHGLRFERFMLGQKVFQNVTYFALSYPRNQGLPAPWPEIYSTFSNLFPNLKTFHVTADRVLYSRDANSYRLLRDDLPVTVTNLVYTLSEEFIQQLVVLSYFFGSLML
jgi:hypothetical protein